MKETITSYIGLDIHKDSIAVMVVEAGRFAPRFCRHYATGPGGTVQSPNSLCKAQSHFDGV